MKLNKRGNISIFIVICLSVIFGFFWNLNKYNKFYNSVLTGIVEEIKSNRKFENSKVAKFVGDENFNYTFWIYAPEKDDLKISDSIYKAKNSEDYQIYRQNSSGRYNFYKILKDK
ncbi:hypothetical protein JOE44_004117 [Chryseobacterium sp. PvR013]|uniref:hypothetical protein n=1 Tax=Chryseobacterium sp. PvR013 TaxID=2806595 RepID=UPI001AE65F11|nr:hypothetical protein [Chryseobacterium sp. PvR013]MBP1167233.1 hypothetical protein [Chryseobacterium sp. PvR013]